MELPRPDFSAWLDRNPAIWAATGAVAGATALIYNPTVPIAAGATILALLFFIRRKAAVWFAVAFAAAAISAFASRPRQLDSEYWYCERTYTAEVLSVRGSGRSQRAIAELADSGGAFRCCLRVSGEGTRLRPGDVVRFRSCLRTPEAMYPLTSGPGSDRISAGATLLGEEWSIVEHISRAQYIPHRLGRYLSRAISAAPFTDTTAALLDASLFGDVSSLGSDSSFKGSGLMHLLCVSGFHVALVLSFFVVLLWPLRLWPRLYRWHPQILLIPVWLFVLIAGASAPAVRAAVMLSVVMAAMMMERIVSPLNCLAGALAVITVADPYAVCSAALWLSVCAVAGLIMLSGRLNPYTPETPVKFRLFSYPAACVAAFVAVLPVTACVFHAVPLMSIPAGVCVIPVFPLFVVCGIGGAILSGSGVPCGAWIWLTDKLGDYIASVADFFASLPSGILVGIYPDAASMALLCAGVAILIFVVPSLGRRRALAAAAIGLVALGCAFAFRGAPKESETVMVDRLVVATHGDSASVYVFSGHDTPLAVIADYLRERRITPDRVRAERYPAVMRTTAGEIHTLRHRRAVPPAGAAVYVATNSRAAIDAMFDSVPSQVFVAPTVKPAIRRAIMDRCAAASIPACDLALGSRRLTQPGATAR